MKWLFILDFVGAILQGSKLTYWLCRFEGFFHTTFGKNMI